MPQEKDPMKDAAYDTREIQRAIADEREVERAPLADRKEGQANYLATMRERPEVIAERVAWLLDGNYGYGWMMRARQATSRMNRPAIYCQMIAILDFQCPSRMATDAWKKLTKPQQAHLQRAVEQAIEDFDRELARG
jgi:hypothetical protein